MSTFKLLLINLTLLLTIAEAADVKRDKRTIDFVIRGFADVFGYDVMKRPSVITTAAPNVTTPAKPGPPAAPGGPKAVPPTFFPPPVAPLPPPKFPLIPRATTQPRVTAPPLLTETVRKSFNFNINWNRNVPQAPQTTAAMPPVMNPAPTVPVVPSTMPPKPPQAPVGKNNAVPLTEQNIQYLYDDIEPHRFKTLKENVYDDYHEQLEDPGNLPVAQILSPTTDDPYNNYQQSKDKFRESITEFWNHSPYYRDEQGYKFLTTPETNDVVKSLEPERSKYEEYDLRNVDYDDDKQEINVDSKEYVEENDERPRENLQYNDNDIEEDDDDKKESSGEDKDSYKAAESKETAKYPTGQKKTNTSKVETIIVTKSSCNHQKKTKPQHIKIKKNSEPQELQNPAYKNSYKSDPSSQVILPQFSGILPVAIDHLSLGEKNHIPWPIPFDTEVSETIYNNKKKKKTAPQRYDIDPRRRRIDLNVAKSKRTIQDDNYNSDFRYIPDKYDASSDFKYIPDSYNPRFDYVAPEEKTENYAKYETLENAEEDEDLKKAQVLTRSFGTRINIIRSNSELANV